MRFFKKLLAAVALTATSAVAAAADYPEKPIRLVVPLAPGGGGDMAARLVADKLGTILGQSIIVENKPGASSVIGTANVATAAPDGYTLLFITDFHAINYAMDGLGLLQSKLPYDSINDFEPISKVLDLQIVLLASKASGVTSMETLREKAKAMKGGMSAATPGVGSPHNLAFLQLEQMGDFELIHVPFGGSGPATTAVQGGQVDLAFAAVGPGAAMAQSGRVSALAVSGAKRDPLAPDVPTIAESGYPGFAIESWMGIVAPKGVAQDRLDVLNAALEKALVSPDVVQKIEAAGMYPAPTSRQAFADLIARDIERNTSIFKNASK